MRCIDLLIDLHNRHHTHHQTHCSAPATTRCQLRVTGNSWLLREAQDLGGGVGRWMERSSQTRLLRRPVTDHAAPITPTIGCTGVINSPNTSLLARSTMMDSPETKENQTISRPISARERAGRCTAALRPRDGLWMGVGWLRPHTATRP